MNRGPMYRVAAVATVALSLLLWATLRQAAPPATARPSAPAAALPAQQPYAPLQPVAEQNAELAALRRQVAALSTQVEQLRRDIAAKPAPMRSPGPLATLVPRPPAQTPDAPQDAEAQRLDAAQREQAFRQEPDDRSRWAREQDAAIRQALATETGLPPAHAVECRARTCRVEFAAGVEEADTALPLLLLQLGDRLGQVTASRIDAGDGRWATVLYLQP